METATLCSVEGCRPECATSAPKWAQSMGFNVCPFTAVRSRRWAAVVDVWNAKHVNPLADWPHKWTAWVQDGLVAMLRASNERERAELDKARRR